MEIFIFKISEMELCMLLLGFCLDFFIEHHLFFLYLLGVPNAFSITNSLLPALPLSVRPSSQHPFFPPALFQDTVQPECGRQAS